MLIQTLHPLDRGERTQLTVGGHDYVFEFNEFGACVCDVTVENDALAILSVGAGYQRYTPPGTVEVPANEGDGLTDEERAAKLEEEAAAAKLAEEEAAAKLAAGEPGGAQ